MSAEKEQYKNLRSGFQYMISQVLGEGWYNYEHDVYNSDDEAIRCMLLKFNKLHDSVTAYKILSFILGVFFVISILFNLILS